MNYEATILKSIFSELLIIDISRNPSDNYQLKQDASENVWAAIMTLEKNSVHTYQIQTCIDELSCAIGFLEEIQTKDDISHITSEINRTIDMLKREIH